VASGVKWSIRESGRCNRLERFSIDRFLGTQSNRKIRPPLQPPTRGCGDGCLSQTGPQEAVVRMGWSRATDETFSDSLRTCVSYTSMEISSRTVLNADYRLECTCKHQFIPILRTHPSEISFLYINFHTTYMLKNNTCTHSKS